MKTNEEKSIDTKKYVGQVDLESNIVYYKIEPPKAAPVEPLKAIPKQSAKGQDEAKPSLKVAPVEEAKTTKAEKEKP
jgi:hypothetical protein